MDTIEKIIIPLFTILASLFGSIFVAQKTLTKSKSSDWLIQLRTSLSVLLSYGTDLPPGTSREELLRFKKDLIATELLLDIENSEQEKLFRAIAELGDHVMNVHQNKTVDKNYGDLYSAVVMQFYKIAASENKKMNNQFLLK